MIRATPSSRAGGLLLKLALVLAVAALILGGLFHLLNRVRKDAACRANLEAIYLALEQFELEKGALPDLAYYPDEPYTGERSLRVVLEEFGLSASACVCPAGHPAAREFGLSYIWNPAFNGGHLTGSNTEPGWLLVDIQALAPDVPPPHLRGYHVLYSNGDIRAVADPLNTLPGL